MRAPLACEFDYPVPFAPENLEKDKKARVKEAEQDLKRMKLVALHLVQSHDLSSAMREEYDHALVNDVLMHPKFFILRHEETMSMVLNWNWQKVHKSYCKVLASEMKHKLKLNPSRESAKFDHSIANDDIFFI